MLTELCSGEGENLGFELLVDEMRAGFEEQVWLVQLEYFLGTAITQGALDAAFLDVSSCDDGSGAESEAAAELFAVLCP